LQTRIIIIKKGNGKANEIIDCDGKIHLPSSTMYNGQQDPKKILEKCKLTSAGIDPPNVYLSENK
jgi:hypothetical protein